ncbi:conserved oligomeric Golgi complex subunit 7 [Macrosteles quadrilineatus]|uniref:conserved oligomeric Golgi complex subunit 7 n=1 Tax=Macrosteles quadrilineatus TaxID=74068 RepID=UPI0023E31F52|nr:conserved oligomeric Golgi complex subunit 7 [Macrosteles quadrilineatus]
MDISAFADDNFDPKEWINKTFQSEEVQDNKAVIVNTMVKKLQLYVQQVNNALEETSQQVLQSLPRVMRDSEMLHQEAVTLRDTMQSVRQEVAKVEKDTGEAMASLERLDIAKTRLQSCKEALHEADNWTVLAADIEEVFESNNIEQIASKLVSMQQSLNILANASDYEERKLHLEGLKNRLEAIASPHLVQAFTSGSIEQARKFLEIFSAMERLPQLLKYYHKCQKGILCQQWHCLVEEQDLSVTEWMSSLYENLMCHWQQQVKWYQQVFGSVGSMGEIYADVLLSLDPSLNVCIDAALKQHNQPLVLLIELKQLTDSFAHNLQSAITSQGKADSWPKVAKAIYAPYIPYVTKYATFEEQHICQQLSTLKVSKDDLMDSVQGLGQSITSASSIAGEALKRCLQFSEGTAYPGLVKALQVYWHGYLEQYSSVLRQLGMRKGSQEDWNMFQMCLTLLQTSGELIGEVKRFDAELIQTLINTNRKSTLSEFSTLLLSANQKSELDRLVSSVLSGEESVLLESVVSAVEKLCRDVHFTTQQVILAPVVSQMERWTLGQTDTSTPDMPDYSFTPQEFITQIGNYLMTLPQHLEPFLLHENPSLTSALRVVGGGGEVGSAEILLGAVAKGTCQAFADRILSVCELSPNTCKQLATDIGYLGNVLEDLGFGLTDTLRQMATLLRLPADSYHTQSAGCPAKLVAAVRQMRSLPSA